MPSQTIYCTFDRPPLPDQGDVKEGNLWRHRLTIQAAIAKISCEAGNSTIHCLEARLWTFCQVEGFAELYLAEAAMEAEVA